ncbi:MAG: hypothetical protein V7733_10320 [Paraglaciecola polaris]|uniref:hypothetical protein n=1 Tax=Paraglaciecola polaris TaxID=222814 RepID=UPI0030034C65
MSNLQENKIRLEFNEWGSVGRGCGGCLSYVRLGIDQDPILKARNAYGQCIQKDCEVYSNEICGDFSTLPDVQLKEYRNRKKRRAIPCRQPHNTYLKLPSARS